MSTVYTICYCRISYTVLKYHLHKMFDIRLIGANVINIKRKKKYWFQNLPLLLPILKIHHHQNISQHFHDMVKIRNTVSQWDMVKLDHVVNRLLHLFGMCLIKWNDRHIQMPCFNPGIFGLVIRLLLLYQLFCVINIHCWSCRFFWRNMQWYFRDNLVFEQKWWQPV